MHEPDYLRVIMQSVKDDYVYYRKDGASREQAVERIQQERTKRLCDKEDRLAILLGIAFALRAKNELTEIVAQEVLEEIHTVSSSAQTTSKERKWLEKRKLELEDPTTYGEEAVYRKGRRYLPQWAVGDILVHELTHPLAVEMGISGKYILFYKVGEFEDYKGDIRQLMLVSLCAPEKLPTCSEDFQKLGFLRMMDRGKGFEYLVQMTVKSKRTEAGLGLIKIGNDLEVLLPEDYVDTPPLVAYPFCGRIKSLGELPDYEHTVCLLCKNRFNSHFL